MERNYKIYMHKNKVNGKVYIGQTRRELNQRFGKDGSHYVGCKLFYRAIKKYGWNNFEHVLLEENIKDSDTANEREMFYIEKYNSTDNNYGYNILRGGCYTGDSCDSFTKEVHQYTIAGYYMKSYDSITESEEYTGALSSNICRCCSGASKTAAGYRWSHDRVDYLGKMKPNKHAKKVYKYSFDGSYVGEYDSAVDAIMDMGLDNAEAKSSHINDCCNGNRGYAYGYQWRREKFDKIDAINVPKIGHGVVQLKQNGDFVEIYSSGMNAANIFDNKNRKAYYNISQCLQNKIRTAYGFIWIWEDEYDGFDINEYNNMFDHKYSKLTEKDVFEIKMFFKNNTTTKNDEADIAKHYNVSQSAIAHIKYNRTWKHVVV